MSTHICMVVDRSGSMDSIRVEAENGINRFLASQSENDLGDCTLSLYEFDNDIDVVHRNVPIKDKKYTLRPRGMTRLYDAIVQAINETTIYLDKIKKNKKKKPLVILVIVTDGMNNCGTTTKQAAINLIKESGFQTTFLCTDISLANDMKVAADAFAVNQTINTTGMYDATISKVTRMRSANLAGEIVLNAYTSAEKNQMGIFCE